MKHSKTLALMVGSLTILAASVAGAVDLNWVDTNTVIVDSTFQITGAKEVVIGIGLNKTPADKGQEPKIATTPTQADGSITQWVEQKTNGALGTAILVASDAFQGFAEDDRNQLVLAKVAAGQSLRYFAGAGWSKAGEFTTYQAWKDYVANAAARARAPVSVTLTPN